MKRKTFAIAASAALAAFLATGSAEASTDQYTVKSGDTLWKIASAHKITVDELKAMNKLTADGIKVDQKLTINKTAKPAAKPAGQPKKDIGKSVTVTKAASSVSEFKTPVAKEDKVKDEKPNAEKPADNKPSVTIQVAPPSKKAADIMAAAVEISPLLLDTPYLWAGVTPEGFDCSGFIHYVFVKAGLDLPRYDTLAMYEHSTDIDDPQPGDLVFFENTYRSGISHAGIYIGDGQFIHAGTKKVEIASVDSVYWKDKFTGYKRFNLLMEQK